MTTLGSKLRAVGQPALAYEAEKLVSQLAESEAKANYWYKKAKELEAAADV